MWKNISSIVKILLPWSQKCIHTQWPLTNACALKKIKALKNNDFWNMAAEVITVSYNSRTKNATIEMNKLFSFGERQSITLFFLFSFLNSTKERFSVDWKYEIKIYTSKKKCISLFIFENEISFYEAILKPFSSFGHLSSKW